MIRVRERVELPGKLDKAEKKLLEAFPKCAKLFEQYVDAQMESIRACSH